MDNSLIQEYLEQHFPSIVEKREEELPDTITLPDTDVLTRVGLRYKDGSGNTYTYEQAMGLVKAYQNLPDTVTLPHGGRLTRSGGKYRDERGGTYFYREVRNLILKQKYHNSSKDLKANKNYGQRYQRFLNKEIQGQVDKYTTDGGRYGEDNQELVIGDISYYEQPNMKKVVELLNSYGELGYMITDNNLILISGDEDFITPGVVRLLQSKYRISPDKVGLIAKRSTESIRLIYPGINGNLVLKKVEYSRQINRIKEVQKILTKAYPFLKFPNSCEKFIEWAKKAFVYKACPNELGFDKWMNRDYSELSKIMQTKGGKVLRAREIKPSSYAPYKKGAVDSTVVGSDASKDYYNLYGKELIQDRQIVKPESLSSVRKDTEEIIKDQNVNKVILIEVKKTMDIINQALEAKKITEQEAIKSFTILQRAIREGKDNVVYRLKTIILKALKGKR